MGRGGKDIEMSIDTDLLNRVANKLEANLQTAAAALDFAEKIGECDFTPPNSEFRLDIGLRSLRDYLTVYLFFEGDEEAMRARVHRIVSQRKPYDPFAEDAKSHGTPVFSRVSETPVASVEADRIIKEIDAQLCHLLGLEPPRGRVREWDDTPARKRVHLVDRWHPSERENLSQASNIVNAARTIATD
jgi:hypothetical protein